VQHLCHRLEAALADWRHQYWDQLQPHVQKGAQGAAMLGLLKK
jgi:hypothetical protein